MSHFDVFSFASVAACCAAAFTMMTMTPAPAHADLNNADGKVIGKTAAGETVRMWLLDNKNGTTAQISDYGATLFSLKTRDRRGVNGEVTLGFNSLAEYEQKGNPFFGATVGRVANRIAKGKFTLDGAEYTLATNNGPNHLHGGLRGFDKRVWKAERIMGDDKETSLRLTYTSLDGEEGYPGNVLASVTYTLTKDNVLRLDYEATADKATPINLTNHTYFNLTGSGDVLTHVVTLNADRFTAVDDTLIPTGDLTMVKDVPMMDFTKPMPLGSRIEQVKIGDGPTGYDHNYVRNKSDKFGLAATVTEPTTGRKMEMWTDQPGFQFYTGNFLDGTLKGRGGMPYIKHAGFCLEAGKYPDTINKPQFPTATLRPGETYRQRTEYRFSTVK